MVVNREQTRFSEDTRQNSFPFKHHLSPRSETTLEKARCRIKHRLFLPSCPQWSTSQLYLSPKKLGGRVIPAGPPAFDALSGKPARLSGNFHKRCKLSIKERIPRTRIRTIRPQQPRVKVRVSIDVRLRFVPQAPRRAVFVPAQKHAVLLLARVGVVVLKGDHGGAADVVNQGGVVGDRGDHKGLPGRAGDAGGNTALQLVGGALEGGLGDVVAGGEGDLENI